MRLALLLCALWACEAAKSPCLQCMAIQLSVRREVLDHISAMEAAGEVEEKQEVPISDIIKGICKSRSWKEANFSVDVRKGCTKRVEGLYRTMMQFWGTSTTRNWKSVQILRWLSYSVCIQPRAHSCGSEPVGMGETVEEDRCSVCRAVVKDTYMITRLSKFQPTHPDNESYAELAGMVEPVCDNLQWWRTIAAKEFDEVVRMCHSLVEDYKRLFDTLLLNRTAPFARNFCNGIGICQFELADLPYGDDHDDNDKDEL